MKPQNAVCCVSIVGIVVASAVGCLDLKTGNNETTGGQGGSAGSGQGGTGGGDQVSSSSGSMNSSSSASSSGSSSSSSGGGNCAPEGATMACYPGPPTTKSNGACKEGQNTCMGGNWSACAGFILPQPETCDSVMDTNCDGRMGCKGVPTGASTFGTNEDESIVALAAGPGLNGYYGNVYATGYRDAIVMPDGQPDSAQVLFLKRDPSGMLTDWSNQFDIVSTGHAWGRGLALDPKTENISVVGSYQNGSLNIGGQGLPSANGATLGFLAAFDAAGTFRFSKSFGSDGITIVNDVAVDTSGNIYIGGKFNATIDFGGPTAVATDGYDAFIASYTNMGALRWKQVFAGPVDQSVETLAVDYMGKVYAGTHFNGLITLKANLTLAPEGDTDAVITAHDANTGVYAWANQFGGTGTLVLTDLTATTGSVAAVTAFRGAIDIGPFSYTSNDGPTTWDTAVATLESAGGAAMAAFPFVSDGNQVGLGIAIDSFGDVIVDGYFSTALPMGGSIADLTSGVGDVNAFAVKFDSMLTPRWAKGHGNSLIQAFTDIAVDSATGHLFIGGGFQGILSTFGQPAPTSTGGFDAFLGVMSN